MKKKTIIVFIITLLLLSTVGCARHEHVWAEADCSTPKTCVECGETEGESLGHTWFAATCVSPRICSVCGETEGKELGHHWTKATCTVPRMCSVCGETEGEALGHIWLNATCTTARKCSTCGQTEGKELGHHWVDATCITPKTCSVCGETEGEALGHDASGLSCTKDCECARCGELITALGHDWVDANCTEARTCARCGETEGKALGHESDDPVRENIKVATCVEDGSYDEVVYCSACKTELSRTTKTEKALGHTTNSGVCSRCAKEVYETVSGTGDDIITEITVGTGIYKVHFTNSGSRNFVVWVHDANGYRELAVNEIGNYDGYYLLTGESPYMFEIESSGKWTYTIEPVGTTTETAFRGRGCYVSDIFSASSGKWHIEHEGKRNFVVWLWTQNGRDLIVNEIGNYSGNKLFNIPFGSNAILEIEADGNWSVEPVK